MLIYLMRHGQAQNLAASDRERALTEAGRSEVSCVSDAIRPGNPPVQAVYSSPYVRARQTAAIMSLSWSGIDHDRIAFHDCLIPGMRIEQILPVIDQAGLDSILVVGHMPTISILSELLLDESGNSVGGFSTAAVMCIETEMAAPGLGCLRWYKEPADWRPLPQ